MLSSFAGKVAASHPLEVELLALQKGLEVCRGLRINFLQIEGDSLVLVAFLRQAANVAWGLMLTWKKTMEHLITIHEWIIY